MNVKELTDAFKRFEAGSLKPEDPNCYFWKHIRTGFYYRYAAHIGLLDVVKPNSSRIEKLKYLIQSLWNSIRYFPKMSKHKQLVILHPRTVNIDGKKMDAYSYPFFDDNDVSYWSRSSVGEKQKSLDFHHRSLDIFTFPILFFKLLTYIPFRPKVYKDFIRFLTPLLKDLDLPLSRYEKYFYSEYLSFNFQKIIYSYLFEGSSELETLYVVDSYSKNAPVIAACKAHGIKVVEFQHGIISDYHLGYSVGDPQGSLPLFPDEFLAWGPQWLNGCTLPDNVEINYITPRYLKNVKTINKRNKLLVISQAVIGNNLAEYVLTNINMAYFEEIVFKLHPSENSLLDDYKRIFKGTNVDVSLGDIYIEMNESKSVMGVFSTALFEAIDFGCEVYYCPLHGSEYVENNPILKSVINAEFYCGQ